MSSRLARSRPRAEQADSTIATCGVRESAGIQFVDVTQYVMRDSMRGGAACRQDRAPGRDAFESFDQFHVHAGPQDVMRQVDAPGRPSSS